MSQKPRWGLYDSTDRVWLGDNDGPILYDEEDIAMIAARVVDVRLRQSAGRTRATLFEEQPLRLRDSVDTAMDSLEALQLLESGRVL